MFSLNFLHLFFGEHYGFMTNFNEGLGLVKNYSKTVKNKKTVHINLQTVHNVYFI